MKNRFCFAAVCAASLLLTIEAMGSDVSEVQPAWPPVSAAGNDRLSMSSHDNNVKFKPQGNVGSVGFTYSGEHNITSPQPWGEVTTSCNSIDVQAGRNGSSDVADWFNDGLTKDNMIGYASGKPDELNFAIQGILNVCLNDNTVINLPVRLGQGHSGSDNPWWIGGNVFSTQGDNLVSQVGYAPIWASGTGGHQNENWKCTYPNLQLDGNLVISDGNNNPKWATNTGSSPANPAGHPNANLVMQDDGNLVIYDGASPIWASGTNGCSGAECVFQDDGNLVISTNNGVPIYILPDDNGGNCVFYVSTNPIN